MVSLRQISDCVGSCRISLQHRAFIVSYHPFPGSYRYCVLCRKYLCIPHVCANTCAGYEDAASVPHSHGYFISSIQVVFRHALEVATGRETEIWLEDS